MTPPLFSWTFFGLSCIYRDDGGDDDKDEFDESPYGLSGLGMVGSYHC